MTDEPIVISKNGVRNIYSAGPPPLPKSVRLPQTSLMTERILTAVMLFMLYASVLVVWRLRSDEVRWFIIYLLVVVNIPLVPRIVLFFLWERFRFTKEGIAQRFYLRKRFIPKDAIVGLIPENQGRRGLCLAIILKDGKITLPHEGFAGTWQAYSALRAMRPDIEEAFLWGDIPSQVPRAFTAAYKKPTHGGGLAIDFAPDEIVVRKGRGEWHYKPSELTRVDRNTGWFRPVTLSMTIGGREYNIPLAGDESALRVYYRLKDMYRSKVAPLAFR